MGTSDETVKALSGPEQGQGEVKGLAADVREVIRKYPKADRAYRVSVGVLGGGTTALGLVMMPLPGPGALVTLGGLGILSTEFKSARKARDLGIRGANAAAAKAKQVWARRAAK